MAVFGCSRGWPRRTMVAVTAVLAATGLFSVFVMLFSDAAPHSSLGDAAMNALTFFFIGIFATQFLAGWLATQRPRR